MNDLKKDYLKTLIKGGKTGEIDGVTKADQADQQNINVNSAAPEVLQKCLEVLKLVERATTYNEAAAPESLRVLEVLESDADINTLVDKLFPEDEFKVNEANPFGESFENPSADHDEEVKQLAVTKNREKFKASARKILSDTTVKATFIALLKQEVQLLTGTPGADRENTPLGILQKNIKLSEALKKIELKISQIYLADKRKYGELKVETAQAVAALGKKQVDIERKLDENETGADDVTLSWLTVNRLQTYKRQIREAGFAITPSREKLVSRVLEGVSRGEKMFLIGSTGTGKTQLAVLVATLINEYGYELISWHESTGIRDLFGYRELHTDAKGRVNSGIKPGPVTLAITEGKIVIHDEYTNGQTRAQLSQKASLNAKPGGETKVPGFNGQIFSVSDQFGEIFTGNPKNEKTTKEREELDPAISRMLTGLKVDFMPPNELLEVILGSMIDDAGILPIPKSAIGLLKALTNAAHMMQKCHDGDFSDMDDATKREFATIFGGSIEDLHLNKNFLDTGTILRLMNGWDLAHARGETFAEFLSKRLEEFKIDPKFNEVPEEKKLVETILTLAGLSPVPTASSSEPPFVLPSDLFSALGLKRRKVDVSPLGTNKSAANINAIRGMLGVMPRTSLPPETEPALQQLKEDLTASRETMDFFDITQNANSPQPSWEQIRPKLTPDILERIKKLHNPKLICVPTRGKDGKPYTYQRMATIFDEAKAAGKTSATQTGEDTYVWDYIEDGRTVKYDGQTQEDYFKAQPDWQVWMVEGDSEMPRPDKMPNNLYTDFQETDNSQQKYDYMLKKYKELDIQGITYEIWCVVLMDAMRQGKTIYAKTCLLGNTHKTILPVAYVSLGMPILSGLVPALQDNLWRSRAAVRVV